MQRRAGARLALLTVFAAGVAAGTIYLTGGQPVAQAAASRLAPYRLEQATGPAAEGLAGEIAFLKRRVAARPDSFLTHSALASAYVARARATGEGGWYAVAESHARRSLALMPSANPDAQMALARIALAKHEFAEALRRVETVRSADRGHEGALASLVTIHLALGRLPDAERAAEALLARRPGATSRACCSSAGGPRRTARPSASCAEAKVRQDPETLDVWAWALGRAGRWPEARAALGLALGSGIHDAVLCARAAWVEQRAGRPDAAGAWQRAAAAIDPGYQAIPGVRAMAADGLALPGQALAAR